MADAMTFAGNGWQDANANRYSAASTEVSDAWLAASEEPVTRPAWDVDDQIDMEAAARAQAVTVILAEPAPATPNQITLLVYDSGPEALALMGIVQAMENDIGEEGI